MSSVRHHTIRSVVNDESPATQAAGNNQIIGEVPESQRVHEDILTTRNELLGPAVDHAAPADSHFWHRHAWHRHTRSSALLRFSIPHTTSGIYSEGQSASFTQLDRHDPMGFQWPLSRQERSALQNLYASEASQASRAAKSWLKLIQNDMDLMDRQKAKKLARLGIPHQFRPYVWTMALGSQPLAVRNRNTYQSGF